MGKRAFSIVQFWRYCGAAIRLVEGGPERVLIEIKKYGGFRVNFSPGSLPVQHICAANSSRIPRATMSRIDAARIKHRCMPPCLWVKTNHGKRGLIVNTRITSRCPPRESRNCESDVSSRVLH